MDSISRNSTPTGCLSQIGLLTVVGLGTLSILVLTLLLPPWFRVKAQRQVALYYSVQRKVYERTFVGFDFILADRKWQTTGPPVPRAGELYDVTEYQLAWPVLIAEW